MRCSSNEEIYNFAKDKCLNYKIMRNIALNSACVVAKGYAKWTGLVKIIKFARRCSFKKLGITTCVSFRNELKILVDVLEKNCFIVRSVVYNAGSGEIGLKEHEKVRPGRYEVICNSIAQEMQLDKEKGFKYNIWPLCQPRHSLHNALRSSGYVLGC